MSGKKAQVVCDPTMMLTAEDWMHIQNEKPFAEDNYILCYFMGDNTEHREFAKKLKEKTGYRIIGLFMLQLILQVMRNLLTRSHIMWDHLS